MADREGRYVWEPQPIPPEIREHLDPAELDAYERQQARAAAFLRTPEGQRFAKEQRRRIPPKMQPDRMIAAFSKQRPPPVPIEDAHEQRRTFIANTEARTAALRSVATRYGGSSEMAELRDKAIQLAWTLPAPAQYELFYRKEILPNFNRLSKEVPRCVECGMLFARETKTDLYCSPSCGNRARKRAHDARWRSEAASSSTGSNPGEPRCDAMDKRYLSPGQREDWGALPDDPPNSWERFADEAQQGPDDFDSDRFLEFAARVCEEHGERTRAQEVRALVSKAVTK
jgi:predicted RNA-binding Zn-ribbon protein involved in translation (DUF1610 family)